MKEVVALAGAATATILTGYCFYRHRISCRSEFRSARIVVIDTPENWNTYRELLLTACYSSRVVGLDCEWVSDQSGHRHKIALLQIAPNERLCFLIRLCRLRDTPQELVDLLEYPGVIKVGVAVADDAIKLAVDYGITINSFLDLRYMVLCCDKVRQLITSSLSLKNISADLLGVQLDKSAALRCSDWEKETLSEKEVEYAANDAISAFLSVKKVCSLIQNAISVIFNRFWMFSLIMKQFGDLLDIPFRYKDQSNQNVHQPQLCQKYRSYNIRKAPLYDNCVLQAPDGEVLSTVHRGKAEWYLAKGIATVVQEDPLTVRLSFEPRGRAILDKKYYTVAKQNRCVVCGAVERLARKNVIPNEYRKHFPKIMKSHTSHDILLLCVKCHQWCNAVDQRLREELALKCSAELKQNKYLVDSEMKPLRCAARALLSHGDEIPELRKKELEDRIKRLLQIDHLDREVLQSAAEIDPRVLNSDYTGHGEVVVNFFSKTDGLIALEVKWRQHFLDTMKPGFLPEMWAVDHNHQTLAFILGTRKGDDVEDLMRTIGLSWDQINLVMSDTDVNRVLLLQKQNEGSSETDEEDSSDGFDVIPHD